MNSDTNSCEWISVAPPERKWKKDVGYLQSFCWESQSHCQNFPFWFSGLKKSQSGEFHTRDQPYFHRLQQKEQNMHQLVLWGYFWSCSWVTWISTCLYQHVRMLRHKLRDYPEKKWVLNLVELLSIFCCLSTPIKIILFSYWLLNSWPSPCLSSPAILLP